MALLPQSRDVAERLLKNLQAAKRDAMELESLIDGSGHQNDSCMLTRAEKIHKLILQARSMADLLDETIDKYAMGEKKYGKKVRKSWR